MKKEYISPIMEEIDLELTSQIAAPCWFNEGSEEYGCASYSVAGIDCILTDPNGNPLFGAS